jgi:hypothetical protein
MSGNSQTANYGGRQPDNTQNIKQFTTTTSGIVDWVYKKLPNTNVQVITPSNQSKTVMIPKDLLVLGSINNPSDINLKNNIEQLDNNNNFNKLNPVSFKYKNDSQQKKHFGLIAQELETIYPELVSNNTGFKSVNYIELIPIILSQMKCMQQEIDKLKEELNERKKEDLNEIKKEDLNEIK